MKRILTVVGIPSLVAAVVLIGAAQSSSAKEVQSKFSRQTPQSILAQEQPGSSTPPDSSITPAGSTTPDSSITPASGGGSAAAKKLPANYGMVRSTGNGVLEVRTLDGTSKQLTIPPELSASTSGLQRGSLVGYDTDASGNVTRLEPAEVEREFKGTVSAINGDQVTLQSPSGETMTTPVETATIARMGLTPGKELTVSTYKGTWATKICCTETPAPVNNIPVVPEPTPVPQGGGTPVAPTPVRGMW
ncbi:hypothetical protein [Altericista sp. CCNU0014]|uniref:hypothetical protein n=1 Tax=Altericista sp. CCNU0014 TaxID=3082949 RepID=UPI00384F06A7